ncbi:MAG: hypothetical protein Q8K82_19510 [Gemmatimonadaceae bacterium]|nr:hypothetical protein [Gemmatimonadaceae bacterium]
MSGADWGAVLAGVALIVWINWYFFFSDGPPSEGKGAGHELRD